MIFKNTKRICLALIIICTNCALAQLEAETINNKFRVTLPNNVNDSVFQSVESSTNLTDWESVARNFGHQWQNTFPNTEVIETLNSEQYHEKDLSNTTVFYRLSSSTINNLNNTNSISRFLQQSTFGPRLNDILSFPGLNAGDLNNSPYSYYADWIEDQIDKPVSSHRAYFRERSDPSYQNNPGAVENGTSLYEVGNNPAYGLVFNYWEQSNESQPSENLPNNQGHQYEFNYYTNGNWIYPIEKSRWDAWAANTNANGSLKLNNPNDTTLFLAQQKRHIWDKIAIDGEDQLRQRMAWALSQIFVVGVNGSKHPQNHEKWLKYYDIFVRNAFGNYYDILEEVTYSPHMAYYLTYEKNTKQDGDIYPDENFAREIMQLFTIGLWELNQDGTYKKDGSGNLIPTYSNENITEFAKVFTGLDRAQNYSGTNYEAQFGQDYISPVRIVTWRHDYGPKTNLYGQVFEHSSGGYTQNNVTNDINYVLNHLFQHDNTAPFIANRLIQRFTVSNPSPVYINDVAEAFITGLYNGKGSGDRGCLEATVYAILLHPEARTQSLSGDITHGKLREPYIKFIHYCRSMNLETFNTWGLYVFRDLFDKLGQEPYKYPSVFNFYKSDYQPLGTIIDKNLVAPEFEPFTDVTSVQFPNCIWWLVYEGVKRNDADTGIGNRWYSQGELDLTNLIAIAHNSDALLDRLDALLTAGRLTSSNRSILKTYIDNISGATTAGKKQRVQDSIYLFCMLPEFNTLY